MDGDARLGHGHRHDGCERVRISQTSGTSLGLSGIGTGVVRFLCAGG
ncbi:hypothetical protein BGLA2_1080028 [Burkholderia gladioli]|nr:hypothetical protein BGLA2_1080028 [Burkholderia gladioli]